MADVDILPSRGITAAALVDGNGVAINGTQTVLQLAQRGMRSICEVTPLGVAANGATLLQLAQRGIRNFCPVSELGVATDASTADTLRMRGIQPMVPVSALGVALTGTATVLTLAQRGLGYFCPLNESGTATTLIDPTPLTLHALTGAFALGGETMETVTGYMLTAQAGAFAIPANSDTRLTPPVPSTTSWDPANKGSMITLSGTPLLTADGGAGGGGVRAIASRSSGKFFFSVTVVGPSNNGIVGICNATCDITSDGIGGNDSNAIGLFPDGNIYINNSNHGWLASGFVTTNVVDIAADITGKRFYARINGGSWYGDGTLTGADPVGGTHGADMTDLAAGPYFPAVWFAGGTSAFTANFGPTYTYAKPAGYLDW